MFLCSNRPKHACFGLKTWSPPQKLDMHTFASAPAMTRFITLYAEIQIIDGTVQDCDNLSCFGEILHISLNYFIMFNDSLELNFLFLSFSELA